MQEASVSGSVSRDTVSELFPKRTVTPELLHVRDQQASPAALQNAPRLSEVMNALEAKDLGDGRAPGQHDPPVLGRPFQPGTLPRRVRRALRRGALGNHEFDLGTTDPSIHNVIELSHLQQLSIEQARAQRLTGVDIIVAGGSDTRLLDEMTGRATATATRASQI